MRATRTGTRHCIWRHCSGAGPIVLTLLGARANVDAGSIDGVTPLHVAVLRERREIAAALLGAGADVNARAWDDWTPLQVATACGFESIAAVLLGAGADPEPRDGDAGTPSDMAARCERQAILEEMRAVAEMDDIWR